MVVLNQALSLNSTSAPWIWRIAPNLFVLLMFLVTVIPSCTIAWALRPEWQRSSRMRSRASWVRKLCYFCVQEILVLTNSSVQSTSVCPSTPSCKPDWNFAFQGLTLFGDKSHSRPDFWRRNDNKKANSFFQINFYVDVDNRERARARDKKQRRPISS